MVVVIIGYEAKNVDIEVDIHPGFNIKTGFHPLKSATARVTEFKRIVLQSLVPSLFAYMKKRRHRGIGIELHWLLHTIPGAHITFSKELETYMATDWLSPKSDISWKEANISLDLCADLERQVRETFESGSFRGLGHIGIGVRIGLR